MTVEFVAVNIEDLPESTRGRSGANSNEVVDSFLASPHTTVMVDTGLDSASTEDEKTEAQKRTASIRSSASAYLERNRLPAKLFTRNGRIYLHKDESMVEKHAENARQREENRKRKAAEKAQAEAEAPVQEDEQPTEYEVGDVAEQSAYADA